MRSLLLLLAVLSSASFVRGDDFFETNVRPVLVEHCYKCHSNQPGKEPKGGLRVDSRAALLRGGDNGPALVPGEPDKSKFIEAIRYTNTDMQMPPKGKLSDKALADLVKWVKDGAVWPNDTGATATAPGVDVTKRRKEHWAWAPLAQPALPKVNDAPWARSPSDRFLLAALEAKGLKPAPPAEPRTLLRRVYFDLIGLPPTPTDVEAFVVAYQRDPNTALEAVVTKLLAAPQFGERWARHWLDLVRYGETRGHEFDPIIPNAYQYRDYVIRALNDDVPYNQFVREHVAGDLLSPPRMNKAGFNESILGTGFWFLGEEVHSPVDIRQDQADRFDNRIDVLTKTFMGLTVSCARCHDHKFDAITTKDYYALFGILESSSYRLVRFDTREQHATVARTLAQQYQQTGVTLAQLLARDAKKIQETLPTLLLAAREAILTGPEYDEPTATKDLIFEDFESGTYGQWELSGTAFGDRPQTLATIAPYQGKINAGGKYFVNSHNRRTKDTIDRNDAHQGKMLSPAFTIKHGYITMLVGGGAHQDKTCVNLLLDGKVVRTATGRDNNQMFPVRWDVREFAGKEARIQIVDEHSGSWGNIGVDDIVFTDRMDTADTRTKPFSAAFRKRIATLATKHKLEPEELMRWVALIANAAADVNNPFHAWAKLARDPKADDPTHFGQVFGARQPKIVELPPGTEVVIDYATNPPDAWRPDDAAFGPEPARLGALRWHHGQPYFTEQSAAVYDRFWDQLREAPGSEDDNRSAITRKGRIGRMIRTPTFKVTTGHVYYLVRGSGSAYAAVAAHTLIAGPLHGRLVTDFPDSPTYRWVHHDLTPYKGQYAHIELATTGNSEFAVAMVVQAERTPNTPTVPIVGTDAKNLTELAQAYQTAYASLATGTINDAFTARLANWHLQQRRGGEKANPLADAIAQATTARQELQATVRPESRVALAMLDGNGVDENVFIRGSPKGLGEVVPRRFLEALTGTKPLQAPGSGRAELATWLTDPSVNPFITRVAVNRVWHHLFGRGLVASVDNFGVLGEKPSHPELLDDLALRFARDGWSLKRLIRELVLSSAYRMSSHPTNADPADPQNRLLHRMNLRRMDGEAIRDALLSISGRLDATMYGPSVPIYLTPFLDGRGRPNSGPLDGHGRRSVYLATKRNFLSPFLQAFDTPIPFSTVGRRQVSNVPAQALILLNDPFVHQQAGLWAKKTLATPGTPAERVARMYQAAFARLPTVDERATCADFLDDQAMRYQTKTDDVRVWTDLAHALVNAKEFIFVD